MNVDNNLSVLDQCLRQADKDNTDDDRMEEMRNKVLAMTVKDFLQDLNGTLQLQFQGMIDIYVSEEILRENDRRGNPEDYLDF